MYIQYKKNRGEQKNIIWNDSAKYVVVTSTVERSQIWLAYEGARLAMSQLHSLIVTNCRAAASVLGSLYSAARGSQVEVPLVRNIIERASLNYLSWWYSRAAIACLSVCGCEKEDRVTVVRRRVIEVTPPVHRRFVSIFRSWVFSSRVAWINGR